MMPVDSADGMTEAMTQGFESGSMDELVSETETSTPGQDGQIVFETPRSPPDEPPQPQEDLPVDAGMAAGLPCPSARRATTDSTTERRSSGSMVFIRCDLIAVDLQSCSCVTGREF